VVCTAVGARLKSLTICSKKIMDLGMLASSCVVLQSLDISRTGVVDLSAISNLTCLTELNCSHTQVRDLSALSSLVGLKSLDCAYTSVSNLEPLSALSAHLCSLDCSHTPGDSLQPLSSLAVLSILHCTGMGHGLFGSLTSLLGLEECTSLEVLSLSLGCATPAANLDPLSCCSRLRRLDCLAETIVDLRALATGGCVGSLEEIRLSSASGWSSSGWFMQDFAPLKSCTRLKKLSLGGSIRRDWLLEQAEVLQKALGPDCVIGCFR
jgi:Leucine-rich repeat (LRR) protein